MRTLYDVRVYARRVFFFKVDVDHDVIMLCCSWRHCMMSGSSVYAHRVVLSARSDVMEAMFSGRFWEGNEKTTVKVT